MVSRNCDRKIASSIWRKVAVCGVALLCASGYSSGAAAENINSDWRLTPGLTLSGMSSYQRQKGVAADFNTFATNAELMLKSDARPYYAGLFLDYRISTDNEHTDNLNLGGYFRYNWTRWDATSYLWASKSPGTEHTWLYAGRLRYRFLENQKLGVEAMGTLDHPETPELMFGYYGSVSESLTLKIFAGSGVNTAPDFAAKIELAWTVR